MRKPKLTLKSESPSGFSLPCAHKPGASVWIRLPHIGPTEYVPGPAIGPLIVQAVRFTDYGKVLYDLRAVVGGEPLYHVDSAFVCDGDPKPQLQAV